jgi:hypothetical protein
VGSEGVVPPVGRPDREVGPHDAHDEAQIENRAAERNPHGAGQARVRVDQVDFTAGAAERYPQADHTQQEPVLERRVVRAEPVHAGQAVCGADRIGGAGPEAPDGIDIDGDPAQLECAFDRLDGVARGAEVNVDARE